MFFVFVYIICTHHFPINDLQTIVQYSTAAHWAETTLGSGGGGGVGERLAEVGGRVFQRDKPVRVRVNQRVRDQLVGQISVHSGICFLFGDLD